MSDVTPWDDLPPYELDRILALDLRGMLFAMFDHAPKASASDAASALGNRYRVSEIRAVREEWKAAGKGEREEAPPEVPTREVILGHLLKDAKLGNSREVDRWVRSLVALERAGNVDPVQDDATENWDRLSDARAGILIALTHVLHGEALTTYDEAWLAQLPA